MAALTLKPGGMALADLRCIARGADAVELADGWRGAVEASLAAVRARLAAGESLYGINTGFGKLAKTRISDDELATLQLYLMRSHAAGVGAPRGRLGEQETEREGEGADQHDEPEVRRMVLPDEVVARLGEQDE